MLKALTILCVLASSVAFAERAPELPPHAIAASLGEQVVVNGIAMRAMHFETSAPVQDVLVFYRERWSAADPADRPTEQNLGSWRVIGRQTGASHETVQVRALPGGGSEGYFASSDTRSRPRAQADSPLRLPLGAQTLSVVESVDGSRHATQILARSPYGRSMTERWLRASARLQGFESEHGSDEPTRADGSRALFFKRGGEELIAVVQPAGQGSVVVVHHVSAP